MSVTGTDTVIRWSQFRKLKTHPVGKNYDAETTSEYKANNILFKQKGNAVIINNAEIKVFLNTNESWAVTGKTTDYLLKHEQGHYDVSVIAAKEFYRELFKLAASTPAEMEIKLGTLNDNFQLKINNINIRYDEQTNHSQNKAQQEAWNKAITAEKQKANGSLDNLPD